MLKMLTVQNFALLEHVEVEFGAGLNILTGETGAGKSILIDALGAVLGGRLAAGAIRTGCDSLRVEAVFSFAEGHGLSRDLKDFLAEQATDYDEETAEIIILRQLNKNGRNTVLVNGAHVTLTTLKKLGALLIDIHGQNENLALLKESSQYALIDGQNGELAAKYADAYHNYTAAKEELAEKEESAERSAERTDILKWQIKEIEDAELAEGEDEELEEDIRRLANAERIAEYVGESCDLLEGGGRDGVGVLDALSTVTRNLSDMSRFDNTLDNALKIIEDAKINLQEAAYEVKEYAEDMDFSPARLNKMQRRMDVIDRLRKKYGNSAKEILEFADKAKGELAAIENYEQDIEELKKNLAAAEKTMQSLAAELTKKRIAAATDLSKKIEKRLSSLGMPKARFIMEVKPTENFTSRGADEIIMNFSANPGEELRLLKDAASGGELSRVALAIKAVSAADDNTPAAMVFDEIDTGLGGRTAKMAAECIAMVARHKQVLCITHLPQIAAMADVHLYILKHTENGRTYTGVHELTDTERINEIARMASGADATTASLDNAREMVMHAKMTKISL